MALVNNDPPLGAIQLIDQDLFARLIAEARASPRRRVNYNFHLSAEENPHRFLNVLARGTYVAPHRHLHPPKAESFIVLSGRLAVFIFDDQGEVTQTASLGPTPMDPTAPSGIDLPAGYWHTIAPLTETAVIFEVKPGPYLPTADKEFAPWAPREGEAGFEEYLSWLMVELFNR